MNNAGEERLMQWFKARYSDFPDEEPVKGILSQPDYLVHTD